jgi:hypothetical protein
MSSKSNLSSFPSSNYPTTLLILSSLVPPIDPFADTSSRPQALDDNPFADTSDPINPFSNPSHNASSFSLESQQTPQPGKYAFDTGPSVSSGLRTDPGELSRREEELRRRDEEMQRRQRELDERERRMDAGEGKANWPFCESSSWFIWTSGGVGELSSQL